MPGETPSRPALVLLPGLLCDKRLWQDQVTAWTGRVDILIPDMTLDDSVSAMAARVLASAPERFALGALSMGGYVAFEILRQAPERVTRLALLATSAAPDTVERTTERRAGIDSLKRGRFVGVTKRMLPRLVYLEHVTDSIGDEVRAMATRVGREAFLRQQQAILTRPDSRPLLPVIRIPTLVAVGENDQMTPPAHAEEIHRGISGSKLHYFPRCGHLPPMESPEETTVLLHEWLGGTKGSSDVYS